MEERAQPRSYSAGSSLRFAVDDDAAPTLAAPSRTGYREALCQRQCAACCCPPCCQVRRVPAVVSHVLLALVVLLLGCVADAKTRGLTRTAPCSVFSNAYALLLSGLSISWVVCVSSTAVACRGTCLTCGCGPCGLCNRECHVAQAQGWGWFFQAVSTCLWVYAIVSVGLVTCGRQAATSTLFRLDSSLLPLILLR